MISCIWNKLLTVGQVLFYVSYGGASDWTAHSIFVDASGNLDDNWTNNTNGVRPY